jgi:hypothetical protein
MRFSFNDFESVRNNPKAFADSVLSGAKRGFSPSKFQAFRDAVSAYHNEKNNLSFAINKITRRFDIGFAKNLANKKELNYYIDCLNDYHSSFILLKSPEVLGRKNMNIGITKNDSIYGQTHKIHLDTDSYAYEIFFIVKSNYIWDNELKFPLIQSEFAKNNNVKNSDVAVGIYSLDTAIHAIKCFEDDEIEQAMNEAKKIIKDYYKIVKN